MKSHWIYYINVFIEHRTWFVFAQEFWFFANIISRVSVFDDREKKILFDDVSPNFWPCAVGILNDPTRLLGH